MRQRNLYGIVTLLGLGLTALPGQVPAQIAGPPSSSWATAENEPASAETNVPAVIASTRAQKPVLPVEARLPPIDDGLRPLLRPSATATAKAKTGPPPPPSPRNGEVQRALYTSPTAPTPGKIDPEVIPAAAPPPAPSEAPQSRLESSLALQMTGPASAAPGETLSCVVIARNVGSRVLAGVQVDLPLPESVRAIASEPLAEQRGNLISWNLGNMEAGAERLLKIDVATKDSGDLHLCPTAHFAVAVGLRAHIVRPPFALTVSGPASATVGGSIVWKIQVANHTDAPLHRVTLTCRLTDGLAHSQGDRIKTETPQGLAPGQVYSIDLPVQALRTGRQVLSLSAAADSGTRAQTQGVIMVNELTIPLTAQGPRDGRVGEELAFTLDLSNPGASPSGPMRLTQVLPLGLEFTSASSGGLYNPATQTITWALDGLPAGGRLGAGFKARASKAGDWALAAAVKAEGMADVRTTHAVHITAPPALTLEATAHEDSLAINGETTYEVRVCNQGATAVAGVRLRMTAPDNLLPLQATAPGRWQLQGQQILFDPLAPMRPHNAAVYRIRLRGVRGGTGSFRVELSAEGLSRPILQELTCRVEEKNAQAGH